MESTLPLEVTNLVNIDKFWGSRLRKDPLTIHRCQVCPIFQDHRVHALTANITKEDDLVENLTASNVVSMIPPIEPSRSPKLHEKGGGRDIHVLVEQPENQRFVESKFFGRRLARTAGQPQDEARDQRKTNHEYSHEDNRPHMAPPDPLLSHRYHQSTTPYNGPLVSDMTGSIYFQGMRHWFWNNPCIILSRGDDMTTTTGSFPAILQPHIGPQLSFAQFALRAFGALLGIAIMGAITIECLFSLS